MTPRFDSTWFYRKKLCMKIQYDDRCPTFCHTLKATYTLRNEHGLLAGRGWRQISGRNPTYVKIVVHPSVMYSCPTLVGRTGALLISYVGTRTAVLTAAVSCRLYVLYISTPSQPCKDSILPKYLNIIYLSFIHPML